MRAVAEPDAGRSAADFLDRDDVFEIAEAQSAPLFFHRDAVQAQRAHRFPQLTREAVFAVGPFGERGDLLVSEAGRGIADHVGGFAEVEVEFGGRAHFMSCR